MRSSYAGGVQRVGRAFQVSQIVNIPVTHPSIAFARAYGATEWEVNILIVKLQDSNKLRHCIHIPAQLCASHDLEAKTSAVRTKLPSHLPMSELSVFTG